NNAIKTVSGSVARHGNRVTPLDATEPNQEKDNREDNTFLTESRSTCIATYITAKDTRNGNIRQEPQRAPPEKVITIPPLNIDKLSITSGDEQPLDLSWPDAPLKRVIFLLLAPITFPLALTLPDVRKPNRTCPKKRTFRCHPAPWEEVALNSMSTISSDDDSEGWTSDATR
ncbi:hypothetical protein NECAME_16546, partial [Necator americanus]